MHVLGCLVGFFCQVKSVQLAYLFWYYLLLGMCIEVGDIMFFFCIKNVLISQHLLQHPFCNFFNPKMYLDKSKIPFLLCIQLTISLRIGK